MVSGARNGPENKNQHQENVVERGESEVKI